MHGSTLGSWSQQATGLGEYLSARGPHEPDSLP